MQILCSARWQPSITWGVRHRINQHNKSICETIGNKTTGRKLDSQIKQVAGSQYCKQKGTFKQSQMNVDQARTKLTCQIISIPAKSKLIWQIISWQQISRQRVSETVTNRIHNEFSDLFSGIGYFKYIFLAGKRGQPPIPVTTENRGLCYIKDIKKS